MDNYYTLDSGQKNKKSNSHRAYTDFIKPKIKFFLFVNTYFLFMKNSYRITLLSKALNT